MRVTLAFQCTACLWWNYPQFRDNMSGTFTIVCGHCGHYHHRTIENGRVTELRCNESAGRLEVVHVMKSACQQEPRKLGKIAKLRERMAVGLMG